MTDAATKRRALLIGRALTAVEQRELERRIREALRKPIEDLRAARNAQQREAWT